MEDNKLATEIKSFLGGVKSFFSSLTGGDEYSKKAYRDDPKSSLDEILIACWVVAFLAAGVTMWFGYRFHTSIFENSQGKYAYETYILSIGIMIVGEFAKVILFHKTLKYLFTWKKKTHGLVDAAIIILLVCVVVFAYRWSIDISTNAFGTNNTSVAKKDILGKNDNLKDVEAKYDTQIEAAQKNIDNANSKNLWHGTLTPRGRYLVDQATESKNTLMSQKRDALERMSKKDSSYIDTQLLIVKEAELRFNDYGGKSEYLLIFMIVIVALIEKKRNSDPDKKDNAEDEGGSNNGGAASSKDFVNYKPYSINRAGEGSKSNIQGRTIIKGFAQDNFNNETFEKKKIF